MRVLVTGSTGRIGEYQVRRLREAGHEVRTLDRRSIAASDKAEQAAHVAADLRDAMAVRNALHGMDAVIHLGAIPSDWGPAEDLLAINVQGTWNILIAAQECGVGRVVYYSSVNALGCVGRNSPAAVQLPIRDDHPRHPATPYQLSKHLAEEACRSFSERYGMVTLCLRPVWVMTPEDGHRFGPRPGQDDEQGLERMRREYWAYVDVRDVAEAGLLALSAENVLHEGFLLTADDTLVNTPTAELAQRYYPETPWVGVTPDAYLKNNPHRSLFDCVNAKEKLGWQPAHSWRDISP